MGYYWNEIQTQVPWAKWIQSLEDAGSYHWQFLNPYARWWLSTNNNYKCFITVMDILHSDPGILMESGAYDNPERLPSRPIYREDVQPLPTRARTRPPSDYPSNPFQFMKFPSVITDFHNLYQTGCFRELIDTQVYKLYFNWSQYLFLTSDPEII